MTPPRTLARLLPVLAAIPALSLLPACANRPRQTRSGFLSTYDQVDRINDIEHGFVNKKALANVTAIRLDEAKVLVDKTPDGQAIPPDQITMLESTIRSALEAALAPDYTLATDDAPGVARLRVAVTEVKKPAVILNIHPASKLTGAGLGGATIESELLDQDGNQIAALVESRKGDQFEIDTLSEFDDAADAVEEWARAWRKRLDAARGKSPPSNHPRD